MSSYARISVLLAITFITGLSTSIGQTINKPDNFFLQIDGSKRLHQIDGFGVNANTRSWNGKDLEPALELLLDSMPATIWRVIVESVEKWEDVNDNNDPFTFNWDYYNKLYEAPKFKKAWDMLHYLNERGITDNLMINFMGFAPQWMGIKVIEPAYEDEFVEMIVSFFHYAIKTQHLKFGLIAPTNETEHHQYSEGPHLDAKQHARILRKIIDRMEALGIMGNIQIVAPDNANTEKAILDFIPALMEDSVIMSRIAHVGIHSYGGYYAGLKDFLQKSAYPNSTFWITEWNAWCNGCDEGKLGEYNYNFASKCVGFLLDLLKNGARAAIAWEGYDSYYEHHAPSLFSYWGMLGYEPKTKTYFPRKNFYAIQQVSKFIPPGSWLISVSEPTDSLTALGFYDPSSKRVSLVGINRKKNPLSLSGSLKNLPVIKHLEMFYTDNIKNMFKEEALINIKNRSFKTSIPGNCIFTLTGLAE